MRSVATPERPASAESTSNVVPIEDRDVPVAHKGLHESLYGTGDSALVHGEGTTATQSTVPAFNSDGETLFEVTQLVSQLEVIGAKKVACVYRLLNSERATTFIGMTRDINVCLRGHQSKQKHDDVKYVYVRTFAFPSRARLQRVREEWINALDYTPIGITQDWNSSVKSAKHAMTDRQREEFEETKRKLRQAMADPTLHDELDNEGNYLKNAVEDDDWSAEIDRQTVATKAAPTPALQVEKADDSDIKAPTPMVSPFASKPAISAPPTPTTEALEFTIENADKALDSVRPLLQADGGDVNVIGVSDAAEGVVTVRLVGACGTCSAASTTLRLGIETALREAFPAAFQRVQEIGAMEAPKLSVEVVEKVLDAEVRTAMAVVGGTVTVLSADSESGIVTLKLVGPDALAYGVELVVREKVRGVKSVVFVSE